MNELLGILIVLFLILIVVLGVFLGRREWLAKIEKQELQALFGSHLGPVETWKDRVHIFDTSKTDPLLQALVLHFDLLTGSKQVLRILEKLGATREDEILTEARTRGCSVSHQGLRIIIHNLMVAGLVRPTDTGIFRLNDLLARRLLHFIDTGRDLSEHSPMTSTHRTDMNTSCA